MATEVAQVRSHGNVRLKAARVAAGYRSQQALAEAITERAQLLGLGSMSVGVRQVRRWESPAPPWPQPDVHEVLTTLLGQSMEQLGFTPPWANERARPTHSVPVTPPRQLILNRTSEESVTEPIINDYASGTESHERLYWCINPMSLHPVVFEHAQLGCSLVPNKADPKHSKFSEALARSLLLLGRIEFFDLNRPEAAARSWLRALQAAADADDRLLGCAILGHMAFIPGWRGDAAMLDERLRAARSYARRGHALPVILAWLDAVEAECSTRCQGDLKECLRLIDSAQTRLDQEPDRSVPTWFDWFDAARLAGFKGNVELRAGRLGAARTSLSAALHGLQPSAGKQRSVILSDLAKVEALDHHPDAACRYAVQALDQLSLTWYSTGMHRVQEARLALQPWSTQQCVQELDDRLYDWDSAISGMRE